MRTIFFGVVLLITNFFYAQEEEEVLYTRAGFKIGANYASINGDINDVDPRFRMHLGAVIEFPVLSRFYIQTEVLYSAQGYTFDDEGVENKISLNYLALPVMAKFYITNQISLETGPQLATLANATTSADDPTDEFYNSFESFDFGWGFGGSYMLESGLFFQARYVLGLTNINAIDTIDITNKHGVGQLSVGYLFKTKNNRRQDDQPF